MATKDRTALKNVFANGKYATGEKFADLIDSMKVVQLPVVDPQALGTSLSFIDSISQDADGKITATKKTLDLSNAHELNPFKGWYKTGDTLPTDGFDGAYLYFKDTSELTGQTTIYRWNGTTYADTGTVVDTSNVNTFETRQPLNEVAIDGTGLANPAANALAKAWDAMQLAAKLEGVTTEMSRIEAENLVSNKYLRADNTVGDSNNYDYASFNVSGGKKVVFLGGLLKSEYSPQSGFCFTDAEDRLIAGYPYDNDNSLEASTVKRYVVDVPDGAVYLKTNVRTTNLPAEDFYFYLQTGDSVGDIANETANLDLSINGGAVVKSEMHNYTEFTYGYWYQISNKTRYALNTGMSSILVEIPDGTTAVECIGYLKLYSLGYYGLAWLDGNKNCIGGIDSSITNNRNVYSGVISDIPANAKYVSLVIDTTEISTIRYWSCYIKFSINKQVDGVLDAISANAAAIGQINDSLNTKTVTNTEEHDSSEFSSHQIVTRNSNGNIVTESNYGSVFLQIPENTVSIEVKCFANNEWYNGVVFYKSLTFGTASWLADYPRVSGVSGSGNGVITIPSSSIPTGAKAILVTGYNAATDGCYAKFLTETEVEGIIDKVEDMEEVVSGVSGIVKSTHTFYSKDDAMSQDDELTLSVPNCCKRYTIGCSMNVGTAWEGRISISSIGEFNKGHIEVDDTNIYVYDSSNVLSNTIPHGLTISLFLSVTIIQESLSAFSAKVLISTSNGSYVPTDEVYWNIGSNPLKLKLISGGCSNAFLSLSLHDCDVWLFGDSYIDYLLRGVGQLPLNNVKNLLLDGYPGRTSTGGLNSLTKSVQVASPKILIWALGMNDGDSSTAVNADWLYVFNQIKQICKANAIELVLVTIPTAHDVNNEYKNAAIRESGYKYIDVAAAVGADGTGSWYSGLLIDGDIHPTPAGAKVIFAKYITDVPNCVVK